MRTYRNSRNGDVYSTANEHEIERLDALENWESVDAAKPARAAAPVPAAPATSDPEPAAAAQTSAETPKAPGKPKRQRPARAK